MDFLEQEWEKKFDLAKIFSHTSAWNETFHISLAVIFHSDYFDLPLFF